ncbi:hypothetical protein, partial, partial [Parasitella parasitica]
SSVPVPLGLLALCLKALGSFFNKLNGPLSFILTWRIKLIDFLHDIIASLDPFDVVWPVVALNPRENCAGQIIGLLPPNAVLPAAALLDDINWDIEVLDLLRASMPTAMGNFRRMNAVICKDPLCEGVLLRMA